MRNDSIRPAVAGLALIVILTLAGQMPADGAGGPAVFAASAAEQPPRPAQEDEFVPVKDLGDQEQLPAAPLVMAAYAVAWIAILLYLWFIWRRLARVEGEMAALSRRIDTGAQR